MEKEENNHKIIKGKKWLINKFKRRTLGSPQEYLKILTGLIKKEDISELKALTELSENLCKDIISRFCDLLRKQFHDDIWNMRCKEIISMEKTLSISNKVKRTRYKKDSDHNIKISKSPRRRKKKPPDTSQETSSHFHSYISEISDKVALWVQYGKKWLGF